MTGDIVESIGLRSADDEADGVSKSETLNSKTSKFDVRSGRVQPIEIDRRASKANLKTTEQLSVKLPQIVAETPSQLAFTFDRLHLYLNGIPAAQESNLYAELIRR
jgi:hypothetical protein